MHSVITIGLPQVGLFHFGEVTHGGRAGRGLHGGGQRAQTQRAGGWHSNHVAIDLVGWRQGPMHQMVWRACICK